MRILVTGAAGMLGTDARRIFAQQGHHVLGVDLGAAAMGEIAELDITDLHDVRAVVHEFQPEVVFHGAAYTNVEGCERDPRLAYQVNAFGTWVVAAAAEEAGAKLVAISTDFVFDGAKGTRYSEFDDPRPLSSYGASKRAGEILAQQNCRQTFIVRTSWLYGIHGKNFPFSMINLAKSQSELPIVADQIGTPTYTIDLLEAILGIIETPLYGIYHVSNSGECSWADFARAVLQKANIDHVTVKDITSQEYAALFNSTTRRPPYSVMRHYALEMQGKDHLRSWEAALDAFLVSAREAGKI